MYFQVLNSALEGIELPYAETRFGTVFTDAFPTSCGVQYSLSHFSLLMIMRLPISFSLKDQEFLSNSACLVRFIFSGINLRNGQATALCVK